MGSVGLLYVGAVLFINGLMLLEIIPGKSAAILNFFVGTMQVVFPTLIILQANNDLSVIFGAAGLYLFGFTYLYVGVLQMTGISGEGLGWFSLFVAACAVTIGILQFTLVADPVFGVIWFVWAVLWFLFFLLLGLGRASLTRMTGWFTVFISHLTGTIPAFFLLLGRYETNLTYAAFVGALAVISLLAAWFLGRKGMRTRTQPGSASNVTQAA